MQQRGEHLSRGKEVLGRRFELGSASLGEGFRRWRRSRRRGGPWRAPGRAGRARRRRGVARRRRKRIERKKAWSHLRGRARRIERAVGEQLLDAADRIAFLVEALPDARQQGDIPRPVVAPPAAALQGLQLRKFRLPEAQHMRRQIEVLGDLADGTEHRCPLVGPPARSGLPKADIPRLAHVQADVRLVAPGCARAWLIWFFSACEARNTSTRRGLIGTSCPVFGLRPMRWPLRRTAKLPKDEILTISPRSSASDISAITDSTSSADSLRDKPTSW